MASFSPGTIYVNDWQHHDFVESAEYESPPGVGPERIAGLKVKLDDLPASIAGGQISYGVATLAAIAWTPDDLTLHLRPGGVLILETSGRYQIGTATKTRFGHWQLTVDPLREDGNPDA